MYSFRCLLGLLLTFIIGHITMTSKFAKRHVMNGFPKIT